MKQNSEERERQPFLLRFKMMGKKDKMMYILKMFVLSMCIFGLTYYTVLLTKDFLKGETMVNIKVEKFKFTQMPAITVCYPLFTSMEKLAKLYPEFKAEYELYLKTMNNVTENDFKRGSFPPILKQIKEKADYFANKAFNSLPVYELFDKQSIPFKYIEEFENSVENISEYDRNLSFNVAIEATVKGLLFNNSKNIRKISLIKDLNPIESIVSKYGRFSPRKCFTFFSQLKDESNNYKIKIESFHLAINHNKKWFTINPNDIHFRYYFSMHSPDFLPLMDYENNYLELKTGYLYSMSFSRIRTILLPSGYKTNCREYNTYDINGEQSQIDCIDRCVLKSLRDICGHCIQNIGALLRREYLKNFTFDKMCNNSIDSETSVCYYEKIGEIHPKCRSGCSSDCVNNYFDYNIDNKHKLDNSLWDGKVYIDITRNRLPDQEIRHMPAYTFVSYLASFGGLAGMWLGMSVFAAYNLFEKIIR